MTSLQGSWQHLLLPFQTNPNSSGKFNHSLIKPLMVAVNLAIATAGVLTFESAPAVARTYQVQSTPENVIWGELFKPNSKPILRVKSGDRVILQTISHEGILPDQGDTVKFLGQGGIPENPNARIPQNQVLADQLKVKAQVSKSGPGPHVITGPIYVEGAEPGDVLEVRTLKIDYRVPYGVISNRHSKGGLPGEYPENNAQFSPR